MDLDARTILGEIYTVYGQFAAWKFRNIVHAEPVNFIILQMSLRRIFRRDASLRRSPIERLSTPRTLLGYRIQSRVCDDLCATLRLNQLRPQKNFPRRRS